MSTSDDPRPDRDEDPGLLDETSPLPPPGGEGDVPSEGGDDDYGPAGDTDSPGPDSTDDP